MKRLLCIIAISLLTASIGYSQNQEQPRNDNNTPLALTIKSNKSVYQEGEQIVITLTIRNLSKEKISVNVPHLQNVFYYGQCVILNLKKEKVFGWGGEVRNVAKKDYLILEPGQSKTVETCLGAEQGLVNPLPKPDIYTITCFYSGTSDYYDFKSRNLMKIEYPWADKVVSNEIAIRIRELKIPEEFAGEWKIVKYFKKQGMIEKKGLRSYEGERLFSSLFQYFPDLDDHTITICKGVVSPTSMVLNYAEKINGNLYMFLTDKGTSMRNQEVWRISKRFNRYLLEKISRVYYGVGGIYDVSKKITKNEIKIYPFAELKKVSVSDRVQRIKKHIKALNASTPEKRTYAAYNLEQILHYYPDSFDSNLKNILVNTLAALLYDNDPVVRAQAVRTWVEAEKNNAVKEPNILTKIRADLERIQRTWEDLVIAMSSGEGSKIKAFSTNRGYESLMHEFGTTEKMAERLYLVNNRLCYWRNIFIKFQNENCAEIDGDHNLFGKSYRIGFIKVDGEWKLDYFNHWIKDRGKMKGRRPVMISVIGWLEAIIGSVGSLLLVGVWIYGSLMEKKRLLGIKIISSMYFLLGVLWFAMSLSHIIDSLLVFYFSMSVLFLWGSLSTWQLRPKSRMGGIALAFFGAMSAFGMYVFSVMLLGGCCLAVSYFIWVIIYLTRPKVKEQFKQEEK